MSRFVYCHFWHPGRGEWLDSYLNIDQIARAQLDTLQPDKTRVWLIGDDVGILTDWDWNTAASMLGVVAMTQPASVPPNTQEAVPAA